MIRPIDGNALIELINGGYDLDFDEVQETKRELLRMIMEQPTVDAVPVRHGKWEKIPSSYEVTYACSECGEKTDETIMGLPRYVYCPMCGARMVEYDQTD